MRRASSKVRFLIQWMGHEKDREKIPTLQQLRTVAWRDVQESLRGTIVRKLMTDIKQIFTDTEPVRIVYLSGSWAIRPWRFVF